MDPKSCTRTKKDLIENVADATGQSRSGVKRTIQVAFDYIVDELGEGNRLEFRDFGVFDAKVRPGRIAQNPKTLQPVEVPPRRTVKFKASRSMRDRLKIEDPSDQTTSSASDATNNASSTIEAMPHKVLESPAKSNGQAASTPGVEPAIEKASPAEAAQPTATPFDAPVNPRGAAV
jgi:integration host factor subunit beta